MPRVVHLHSLPRLVPSEALADGVAVVIDVLRATTTIATALARGAKEVRPCLEPQVALGMKTADDSVVLGGERRGVKIPGFDLGNSPAEYTREAIGGRAIAFTTTNGTRAIYHCCAAQEILLAAFVNLRAVIDYLAAGDETVHIVCAGTDGEPGMDDCLVGGAIARGLQEKGELRCNDQALLSIAAYSQGSGSDEALKNALRSTRAARNLASIRLGADVAFAARRDLFDLVPRFERTSSAIRRTRRRPPPSPSGAESVETDPSTPTP